MCNRLFRGLANERESVIIGVFPCVYILYAWFQSFSFTVSFPDALIFSQAMHEGVDIGARISAFYKLVLGGAVVFLLLYISIRVVLKKMNASQTERETLVLLSAIGTLLQLADIYGHGSRHVISMLLILMLLYTMQLLLRRKLHCRYLTHPKVFLANTCVAMFLVLMGMYLYRDANWKPYMVYWMFPAAFSLSTVLLITVSQSGMQIHNIFRYLSWLSFVPMLALISNEMVIWLRHQMGQTWITANTLFFVLSIISISLYMLIIRKRRIRLHDQLTRLMLPGILSALVLYSTYEPLLFLSGEEFELSNIVNAQMRLFAFGEIPFLDFMSSHMMSEQWTGWIYHLIFGYNGSFDFLSYAFLEQMVFVALIYTISVRLFNNALYAFLFVLTFPLLRLLFTDSLYMSVLLLLPLYQLAQYQTIKGYVGLFLMLLFFIFWRLDLGSAAILSVCIVWPIMLFTFRQQMRWSIFAKACSSILLLLFVLFAIACLIRDPHIVFRHVQEAWHYISANQAHGYAQLSMVFTQQFYFFHVLIPFLSVLGIGISAYQLRLYPDALSKPVGLIRLASLFYFVMVIVNFQRGLVRHGFMEFNDTYHASTFYLAVTLLCLSFLQHVRPVYQFVSSMWIAFLLIVTCTYFPMAKDPTMANNMLSNKSWALFEQRKIESDKIGRIANADMAASLKPKSFNTFLSSVLLPDQTFLDFSNSPIWYVHTQRKIPSYFCQSLQNTVDEYCQLQQLKQLDTQRVPIVVYANEPATWFDATDGVPNALRYFHLAEYIYLHYQPWKVMDGKQIWLSNRLFNLAQLSEPTPDTLIRNATAKVETHAYGHSAAFTARYFDRHVNRLQTRWQSQTGSNQWVQLRDDIDSMNHLWLQVNFLQPYQGECTVQIQKGGSYTFEANHADQTFMVRLSNQWLWHQLRQKKLMLRTTQSVPVELTFYEDRLK